MSNIIPFPPGGFRTGGGGPEDPMLEARTARLEDDMKDIKSSLKAIDAKLSLLDNSLARIEGRLSGLEGRFMGIDARFAALPTTWTMLTIIFGTWGIGSGILIFALNFLKR